MEYSRLYGQSYIVEIYITNDRTIVDVSRLTETLKAASWAQIIKVEPCDYGAGTIMSVRVSCRYLDTATADAKYQGFEINDIIPDGSDEWLFDNIDFLRSCDDDLMDEYRELNAFNPDDVPTRPSPWEDRL